MDGSTHNSSPLAAVKVEVEEAADQADVLTALFGSGDPEISVSLGDQTVVATLRGSGAPVTVALSRENQADAVAAALRTLGRDVCLHRALAALIRRFAERLMFATSRCRSAAAP